MSKLFDIHFSYAEDIILKNVDLELYEGEIHALVGLNGAGKSTCMKIIAGLLEPSTGECQIEESRIGWLGEDNLIYPGMKVKDCLSFLYQMYMKSLKGFDSSWNEISKELRLDGIKDRLIGNLSFGNKRRVAIAAAFIHQPDLIILDEPAVGLDPEMVSVLRDFLNRKKDQRKILISSHQLDELSKISDRVSIIHEGSLVFSDQIDELKKNTENSFWIIKGDIGVKNIKAFELERVKRSEFRFNGNKQQINRIVETILKDGETLEAFYLEKESLEDIFLEMIEKGKSDDSF